MTKIKIFETISYNGDDVHDDPYGYAEQNHPTFSTMEKALASLRSTFDEDHEGWVTDLNLKIPEFKFKSVGGILKELRLEDGHYVYIIYEKILDRW